MRPNGRKLNAEGRGDVLFGESGGSSGLKAPLWPTSVSLGSGSYTMRDDFDIETKRVLAARVGHQCSRCFTPTAGPQSNPSKALNIGVASHITAAAPGGARYDFALSFTERRSINNGIWLCQNCAKLIDNDPTKFSVTELLKLKSIAEETALARIVPVNATNGPSGSTDNSIWNVPYPPNELFTGRDNVLKGIREALNSTGGSALSQRQAIGGLGGIGKTQTAVEYAYKWHKDYKAVFWVKSDSKQSLLTAFRNIATLLSLPQSTTDDSLIAQSVLSWLTSHSGWLLIFDNADDLSLIEEFFPQKHAGHVLVTSRARLFDQIGILHPIRLDKMLPAEAERFLRDRTGRNNLDENETAALKQLAQDLDYLPLALEQAGAYIARTDCSFAHYMTCYSELGLTLLEKSTAVIGKYHSSVAATWLLNFEQVEHVSNASADVLRASAFLDPDLIPVELLLNGASELGPSISAKLSDLETYPLALDELLSPACHYSLISRDVSGRSYTIHRMVQAALRLQMTEAEQRLWAERVTRAVTDACPGVFYSTSHELDRFLPHAFACAAHVDRFNFNFKAAQLVLIISGQNSFKKRLLNDAEQYFQKALTLSEQTEDLEQSEMLNQGLVNLGSMYFVKGRYPEAESLLLKALSLVEKDKDSQKVALVQCLSVLGELFKTMGRFGKARKYFERAQPILEHMMKLGHPTTTLFAANGLNNLAEFFRMTRAEEKAELLYQMILDTMELNFEPTQPLYVAVLNNLGELYRQRGDYEKAEPFYKRAIEIEEQSEAPERNYDLATTLSNLGLNSYYQGKHQEAESFLLRCIEIEEKSLGPVHPRLAQALNNLGLVYTTFRKHKEAILLFERAISIWESVGHHHADLAKALNNLGNVHHICGVYPLAERLYKEALSLSKEILTETDFDSEIIECLSNLWVLYDEQARSIEAKSYFDKIAPTFSLMNKASKTAYLEALRSEVNRFRERKLNFHASKWERLISRSSYYASYSHTDHGGRKIGRNEPCVCGSGLKFKKCCGQKM